MSRWLVSVFSLLLGVLVLAWGTGYKLSLYHQAPEHDSTPAAKLCTRQSDVAKNGLDSAAEGGTLATRVTWLAPVLGFPEASSFGVALGEPDAGRLLHLAGVRTPPLGRRPPPFGRTVTG